MITMLMVAKIVRVDFDLLEVLLALHFAFLSTRPLWPGMMFFEG